MGTEVWCVWCISKVVDKLSVGGILMPFLFFFFLGIVGMVIVTS